MTISHIRFDENSKVWKIQTNEEHQKGVASLAESFGADIGCGEICRAMGLLHDKGKEQTGFQEYIKYKSGYDENIRFAERTPHAYVGALLAQKLQGNPLINYIISRTISAHHSGLKDYVDYNKIMEMTIPSGIAEPKLAQPSFCLPASPTPSEFHHIIRMLYSCLVDADFLDTETFMNGKSRNEFIGKQNSMSELLEMLETRLKSFDSKPKTRINEIRSEVQSLCRLHADSSQGIYSLTVPTGGGKTLSSLLWALRHAVKHRLSRVIIAIPYTSIIVQTAQILRDIFGASNVLEHHSAFDADEISEDGDTEFAIKQRLASENWDYPIVVTTNVQLFQSMMASKPSRCRKLHNIKNSVIILDEAQMLPTVHLQPIIDMLKTYQHLFKCSILLTTASQPVLTQEYIKDATSLLKGLDNITEIIPTSMDLHNRLRRVQLHFIAEKLDYDAVAKHIMRYKQVLCIVNTRRDALEIFSRLPKDDGRHFHLSRMMCTEHLAETIHNIREALSNDSDKPIRVVATQLIEAGVDVDFETVLRQEAGLDSILQAAGRCNREGRNAIGETYVFSLNKPLPNGFINYANAARLSIPQSYNDYYAPETMREFFRQLYSRCDNFDKSNVKDKTSRIDELQFETVANEFKLIEDNGVSVIINYHNSAKKVEMLKAGLMSYQLKKELSRYSVCLNYRDFDRLRKKEGIIEKIAPNIYYIPDAKQYDSITGLSIINHYLNEIQII